MLGDQIITNRLSRKVFAKARLLEAAMRGFGGQRNMIIDPDGAEFQLLGNAHRTPNILGEYRRGQAKYYIISQIDGFIFIFE